jgi:hypothetical protein
MVAQDVVARFNLIIVDDFNGALVEIIIDCEAFR